MELISDRDFDGYLLTRFDCKCIDKLPGDIQTAALVYDRGRFFIRVVYEWFSKLTNAQRVAVMKHEVGHFVLKHMSRRNGRYDVLWNIAGDMALNQDITNLPEDTVKLVRGWPAHEPTEIYYDKLLQMAKKQQKGGKGKGSGKGQNQKGSADPNQGDQEKGESGGDVPKQWDTVMDASPTEGNDADSMTDDILRETIKERLNAGDNADNLRGLHAGALSSYVDDLTKPPMIDWKQAITRFVASLSEVQTRLTLKKPDRRCISPYGKKREYLPALVVCIDTSGSVSNELLSEFFSQIALLGRILSEVDVVIADADVQDYFVYHRGLEATLKKKGYGRGGTDFEPAVRYINKNLGDRDGAIYLTDGFCPAPQTKCKIPIIWVVTDNDEFEGRPKIKVNDKS